MQDGNIKAIDRTSVHKICSGQVVLTLGIAIKELVENSIDAGATTIDIQLKEYGSEIVEVIDNGKGVKSEDFQSLTLKHHTSKIADFSDLPFVSTFGFRGEALSSLCALCDLEISTRHKDSEVGILLAFDHNGTLIKKTNIPRQVGTTVTVKNLFHTFPVRHKEFSKHIRREYQKALQVLTAYCLISVNVRIMCSNTTAKGKKNLVLSTSCCKSFEDNIISLFGDKQIKTVMKVVQQTPSKDVLDEFFLPETAAESCKVFKLEGFISNSTHGEGRSSTDRQFYFLNGRPCDMLKVMKLINEVYHTFNRHQYPFVFINIILLEGCADVNVTPDKRQVFIPNEKILLPLIKSTLLHMYGSQPSQVATSVLKFEPIEKVQEKSTSKSPIKLNLDKSTDNSSLKRKFEVSKCLLDDDGSPFSFKNRRVDNMSNGIPEHPNCISNDENWPTIIIPMESQSPANHSSSQDLQSTITNHNVPKAQSLPTKPNMATGIVNFTSTKSVNEDKFFKNTSLGKLGSREKLRAILDSARKGSKLFQSSQKAFSSQKNSNSKTLKIPSNGEIQTNFECEMSNRRSLESSSNLIESDNQSDIQIEPSESELESSENFQINESMDCSSTEIENEVDEPISRKRKVHTCNFSMDIFKKPTLSDGDSISNVDSCPYRKFRAKINPTENTNAEEELKKEISKDSFTQMEIVGQFNLGFIIVRLKDDLFIIDQHATDEKYNFEQLKANTVLETQQLFQPQNLNLTAVTEATLLDNLNVFEMNGFKFKITEENPSGQKVQLVSVPTSQNWRFGKEDVDELIFMLTDNDTRMVRPSRVNQMFASRACRKSVMIGTALTLPLMKKLVLHMGEIQQPWNCPHGRPTIRHLFNLNLLKKTSKEEGLFSKEKSVPD